MEDRKKTAGAIVEALAIARRLYKLDALRYQPLFGLIGRSVKQRRPSEMIRAALIRLEARQAAEDPPLNVAEYFGGTMRALEQQRDAQRLRAGKVDGMPVMDVLAELLRRSGYEVKKR